MPELPEVETVKNHLKSQLIGLQIDAATLHHEKMIKTHSATEFAQQLIGQSIVDVKRRGKYLIFELTDYHLLSHLRMEGKFFYGSSAGIREKHVHATFLLSNAVSLYYEDVRKFGTFHLYEKNVPLETTPSFLALGPEPWEAAFNAESVFNQLQGKKAPIKSLLLAQKVVAGLGNIYVDEVLFASKVHPMKKSGDLTRAEIESVVHYTKEILARAIRYKGTTIRTFASQHGSGGEFQTFLRVHTKKDAPCPRCATPILKGKVGGRGTYFCAACQKEQ